MAYLLSVTMGQGSYCATTGPSSLTRRKETTKNIVSLAWAKKLVIIIPKKAVPLVRPVIYASDTDDFPFHIWKGETSLYLYLAYHWKEAHIDRDFDWVNMEQSEHFEYRIPNDTFKGSKSTHNASQIFRMRRAASPPKSSGFFLKKQLLFRWCRLDSFTNISEYGPRFVRGKSNLIYISQRVQNSALRPGLIFTSN